MAFDKVIDSQALEEKLTSVAHAIREKSGKTEEMTLEQMPEEIRGIQGSAEIKFNKTGQAYAELVATLPNDCLAIGGNVGSSADAEFKNYPQRTKCFATYGVIEGYAPEVVATSGHYPFTDANNPLLQKIVAPKCTRLKNGTAYYAYKVTDLTYVQLGSIGYPVTLIESTQGFSGCTNASLVIEIYVDAATLSAIPAEVAGNAPWGATKATVIYRNSTTGEVITE